MWKRLLVALDFSDCAAKALDIATRLAERERASLTLVHVSPLPLNLPPDARVTPPGAPEPIRIDEYTTHGERERLEVMAAALRARGLDVRTLAVASTSGDVASELLRVAAETGAELMVVGTHGRKGLSHLFFGSVAEKVVRSAMVPVLTIRSVAAEATPTSEEGLAEDELAG